MSSFCYFFQCLGHFSWELRGAGLFRTFRSGWSWESQSPSKEVAALIWLPITSGGGPLVARSLVPAAVLPIFHFDSLGAATLSCIFVHQSSCSFNDSAIVAHFSFAFIFKFHFIFLHRFHHIFSTPDSQTP